MFRRPGVCKNRMAINYGSEGAHTWIHSRVRRRQGLKGIVQNTGTTLSIGWEWGVLPSSLCIPDLGCLNTSQLTVLQFKIHSQQDGLWRDLFGVDQWSSLIEKEEGGEKKCLRERSRTNKVPLDKINSSTKTRFFQTHTLLPVLSMQGGTARLST